ncbi:NUDIX hydrolase [Polaribacter dokdonensis DSW-5]|uniref:NUDIX domain-containing protein n=2 Tax=Polaribacter TaxID=52959 RepID=A0A0M9CEF5_9FLAO|nr:NUDIX hydrolase [Polaribacter dokdonensis DSW-5]SEE25476.1 NUDIX domain-containing protein [Polaribacter dokdonensis DSW-5]
MSQMYKVFVNDKPIIITSSSKNEKNFPIYSFSEINFKDVLLKLQETSTFGIILITANLELDWQLFIKNLKVIPAAGGLVLNDEKSVLFIYRNEVWDLPKGGIEKGESKEIAAIREVEEECGITNLSIIKQLPTTYHIYDYKGLNLKQTFWFLMHSNDDSTLTPQLEEGITKVAFLNSKEIKSALTNTYTNIKLVYDAYKQA